MHGCATYHRPERRPAPRARPERAVAGRGPRPAPTPQGTERWRRRRSRPGSLRRRPPRRERTGEPRGRPTREPRQRRRPSRSEARRRRRRFRPRAPSAASTPCDPSASATAALARPTLPGVRGRKAASSTAGTRTSAARSGLSMPDGGDDRRRRGDLRCGTCERPAGDDREITRRRRERSKGDEELLDPNGKRESARNQRSDGCAYHDPADDEQRPERKHAARAADRRSVPRARRLG